MIYRRFWGYPRWEVRSPYQELERVRRQMDRLVDGLWGAQQRQVAGVFPLINLTESKDSYFIRAELPGVSADDLDIQATANTITLSGERRIQEEDTQARYHRRERESGRFSRVVGLPGDIDQDKVEASLVNGILTVVISKAAAAKPRQIAVK
jgi:HSP20 family protein